MKNGTIAQRELKESKELALHYMTSLVGIARESILILDSNFQVVFANPTFYKDFRVKRQQTENTLLYKLGNGQWNIPELRKLMEGILSKKKIVKDYKVKHDFPTIGEKAMRLNAKQIDTVQLIVLAIEDITEKEKLEEKLSEYTKGLETKIIKRTAELANKVKELESINKSMVGRELKMVELKKEIADLKKRIKNGNGKNGKGRNGNHKNG